MSLSLERHGTEANTVVYIMHDEPLRVSIGGREINLEDFLDVTYYILTNAELMPGDPRLPFIERIKSLYPVREKEGRLAGAIMLQPREAVEL